MSKNLIVKSIFLPNDETENIPDEGISSRKAIKLTKSTSVPDSDVGDRNPSTFIKSTIWNLSHSNQTNQRLKLFVKDYNNDKQQIKIKKNTIISFYDDCVKFDEKEESHQGTILFGRMMFDMEDSCISRKQFKIIIKDKMPFITCLIAPPKMPTSFVITEEAFFLEKGHIISFGKSLENNLFLVESMNGLQINFQQISFSHNLNRKKTFLFDSKDMKGAVLGSFMPLDSPFIESFKIVLGFDSLHDKWYLRKKWQQNNEDDTYIWVLKFEELINMNFEQPSENFESKPVALKEKLIINVGSCNLEVMKNE